VEELHGWWKNGPLPRVVEWAVGSAGEPFLIEIQVVRWEGLAGLSLSFAPVYQRHGSEELPAAAVGLGSESVEYSGGWV